MNSSEFMLNNQVYTQKKAQKNENSNEKHSSIFWFEKEAYNFVFINVKIM